MKPWIKWTTVAVSMAIVAGVGLRLVASNKAKKEVLESQQAALKVPVSLELGAADLVRANTVELTRTLPVSGPIKAVSSAFVKARVAGELQGLTVREGDMVKAGQVLARVDSTEYQARTRQAQQQAESAKAQVDIARRSFENNRKLVDQGFISQTALESSSASLAAAEASYRAAMAGVDVAAKSLEDTVLRAPISGQVAQRLTQPGERVAIDARVLEIVDLSRLEVEASLAAADSLGVKPGQTAQLTVEGSAQRLQARVARINPSAVAGSRSVLVYLSLEKPEGLRQGLFAQGALAVGGSRTLALPVSAIRTDKPQPYVQWVQDNKVAHQTVELGERGEANGVAMVSVKGIPEGTQVLAGAVGALRAGTAIKNAAGSN
ncbi:efflux RND transporter periplasmic adaptor subunit [Rhodoferax mekongensis]|uniref:Efflux RND transporter periplasmic adaptor subunit n=1 Tax=Rhodoferax mekongensis TaxID=3068341 RepID=A0ABZ0AXU8_9BURK|nr:efflux RND transporter periplasmic adaptor subunit [Rhodoferax sp. TBRC 17307]WNO04477.1 efflux RND transporter periplasmic adaptor subunit [Rhodoferax sp. TBRC 17307]